MSKGVYKVVEDKATYSNELKALKMLSNTLHFAQLICHNTDANCMYIERGEVVYEMFAGLIKVHQFIPFTIARSFTSDLLAALSELHDLHFCHGDIKLENIMFSTRDAKFKLFDFGLSGDASQFPSLKGSITYLPPECFERDIIVDGHACDIWSSGICIFCTWCNMRPPWMAANEKKDTELFQRHYMTTTPSPFWSEMCAKEKYVFWRCFNSSKYMGPSIICHEMLRVNHKDRKNPRNLQELWKILSPQEIVE